VVKFIVVYTPNLDGFIYRNVKSIAASGNLSVGFIAFYSIIGDIELNGQRPARCILLKLENQKGMNETSILLKAYYEALYEKLESRKELLIKKAEELLVKEITSLGIEDKYAAYRDACVAFIDERIELYNPIGIQYLYDRSRAKDAFEIQMQLDWYDSRAEFAALVQAASLKVRRGISEDALHLAVQELIEQVGAFPDKSIISAYEAKPGLQRLPDYIVARTIEESFG